MTVRIRGLETGVGEPGYCTVCETDCERGPDPCIGYIPGVSHACCGHGGFAEPYVVLGGAPNEGVSNVPHTVTLRGEAALHFFALVALGEHRFKGQEKAA